MQRSSVGCEWDEGRSQVLEMVFALAELVAVNTGVTGWLLRMCWEANGGGLVSKHP